MISVMRLQAPNNEKPTVRGASESVPEPGNSDIRNAMLRRIPRGDRSVKQETR